MPTIELRTEAKRGCGYRQPGGTYLVSGGPGVPCLKMPVALTVCPTCHAGWKPTRSWTWIDVEAVTGATIQEPLDCGADHCKRCPLRPSVQKAGLLWIGEKFYPKPEDWTNEATGMGVSRRVPAVPKDFVLGETWVLVAHRKAVVVKCPTCVDGSDGNMKPCHTCNGAQELTTPGLFHAFRPQRVEYVVRGDETDEELENKEKRGITLVKVKRDIDEDHED